MKRKEKQKHVFSFFEMKGKRKTKQIGQEQMMDFEERARWGKKQPEN